MATTKERFLEKWTVHINQFGTLDKITDDLEVQTKIYKIKEDAKEAVQKIANELPEPASDDQMLDELEKHLGIAQRISHELEKRGVLARDARHDSGVYVLLHWCLVETREAKGRKEGRNIYPY